MVRIPARIMPHKVVIERLGSPTPTGVTLQAPVTVRAMVHEGIRQVRSASGDLVAATCTVVIDPAPDVLPGSRVTIFPGQTRQRRALVISMERSDTPGTPSHIRLGLE